MKRGPDMEYTNMYIALHAINENRISRDFRRRCSELLYAKHSFTIVNADKIGLRSVQIFTYKPMIEIMYP